MKVLVVGIKWFEDAIDGKEIDSGSLFTECALDDRRNGRRSGAKGNFSETWRMPNAESVRRLSHVPLPFDAELIVTRMGNGKAAREVVTDCRPIDVVLPPSVVAPAAVSSATSVGQPRPPVRTAA